MLHAISHAPAGAVRSAPSGVSRLMRLWLPLPAFALVTILARGCGLVTPARGYAVPLNGGPYRAALPGDSPSVLSWTPDGGSDPQKLPGDYLYDLRFVNSGAAPDVSATGSRDITLTPGHRDGVARRTNGALPHASADHIRGADDIAPPAGAPSVPVTFHSPDAVLGQDSIPGTIKAVIPETQSVTSGARVMLALSDALHVHDVTIPRGTLLYGESRIAGDRMEIRIGSIIAAGVLIRVALTVYDLDGLEGIHVPRSTLRRSAKAVATTMLQDAGTALLRGVRDNRLAAGGIYAARNLGDTRLREARVTIRAGYQILLKDNTRP